MRWPGLVGPSYVSSSPIADNQELINWYVERMEMPGAKVPYALYPTPGVEAFVTVADTPGRGLFAEAGRVFAVIGSGFYEVFSTGTATLRGTVARDQYPATLCSNGVGEILVTSGDHAYLWDIVTSTFTEVLTSGATMAGSLGGYFIVFSIATSSFRLSGLLNGSVWDPNQNAERTLAPDPWRSMLVANGYVWLFGEKTTEIWENSGSFPFPFTPLTTSVLQFGIAGAFAAASLHDTLVWLNHNDAGTGLVMQTRGINPSEIQTHPLAVAIGSYADITDAVVWGYQAGGHPFLNFDFPSANTTWTYDNQTGLWAKRGTWDSANAQYNAWRPCGHAHEFGVHLVIDRGSGTIYRLADGLGFDVDGLPIRRLRRASSLFQENRRLYLGDFEVLLESGLGLPIGQGSNPQILLRWSRNGGKTFGSARSRSAGEQGQFGTRVRWARNGSGRDNVPELVVSDPIPWRILDAFIDLGGKAA